MWWYKIWSLTSHPHARLEKKKKSGHRSLGRGNPKDHDWSVGSKMVWRFLSFRSHMAQALKPSLVGFKHTTSRQWLQESPFPTVLHHPSQPHRLKIKTPSNIINNPQFLSQKHKNRAMLSWNELNFVSHLQQNRYSIFKARNANHLELKPNEYKVKWRWEGGPFNWR